MCKRMTRLYIWYGINTITITCPLFQLGDVELTKAWLSDLATLGHKIPTFDQPVKEQEHSCAEKVDCWLLPGTTSETLKDRDWQARLLFSTICSSQTLHFVNLLIIFIQHVIHILYFPHVLHLLFILFICILRCNVYIIFVCFACFDSPNNLLILHSLSCVCSW